jgi:hypothetical protein
VSGGFGFAGLALGIVSLTTNWTSGVVVSHGQYSAEMNAPSSGLTVQRELNMYASGWHALLLPRISRSGGTPGWAKGAAASAIVVGLVGALLAVLTVIRGVRRAPNRPCQRGLSERYTAGGMRLTAT